MFCEPRGVSPRVNRPTSTQRLLRALWVVLSQLLLSDNGPLLIESIIYRPPWRVIDFHPLADRRMPIADSCDTIVALSSPPGPGRRAIVRISGPGARRIAATVFDPADALCGSRRSSQEGQLQISGLATPLPADAYIWPSPRTYTGQDLIELHTLSCPPLLDSLVADLLNRGCRAALPGEFTLRAFLAGKLDLPRAEAILGVIEAGSRQELKRALDQLSGGVTRPLEGLREDLLDLLADVEAGLDFAEEDIQFVDRDALLGRIARGLAQVTLAQKQLGQRAVSNRPFRVVLAGRPNVGKSSLFNALTGGPAALVSELPGTTRDYLVGAIRAADVAIEVVDTAGWRELPGAIEEQAGNLGRREAEQGDLLLLCLEAGLAVSEEENSPQARGGPPPVLAIATKCDLAPAPLGMLATSAPNGIGLDALRELLLERARAHSRPPLAPSLSRCRHHLEACLNHLRQAHAAVLFEEPAEVLALELRGALEQLGEMVGAVYTDDLLDRIFSRFCIGK
jgi:tRNA modification GTPase